MWGSLWARSEKSENYFSRINHHKIILQSDPLTKYGAQNQKQFAQTINKL
jgi:hypothetical protein